MDISFEELVKIRTEEMKSMMPNMQTVLEYGDKKVIIKSPSADEIVKRRTKR